MKQRGRKRVDEKGIEKGEAERKGVRNAKNQKIKIYLSF